MWGKTDRRRPLSHWALLGLFLSLCGCTGPMEYFRNGFKVGPNYRKPPAPVAPKWIDADDVRIKSDPTDGSNWWTVFNDPILNDLIQGAYNQNLTLREAGFRVLENRAMLMGVFGNLFPQTQNMDGYFKQINLSRAFPNDAFFPFKFFPIWNYGFNLAWELDFWGRYRRALEASRDELDASVENYDDVLVTLLGDVASAYVEARIEQQQIAYARQTLALQQESLKIATAKFKGGQVSEVDVNQGKSDVASTQSLIEQKVLALRQTTNRLCVLLGLPPEDLIAKLGEGPIPPAPPEVIVGVPADLLRRRPDVRRAERHAAAQNAQIGVAISELYPHISITGSLGWKAQEFKDLFRGRAFRGDVGPSFTWDILEYGRLLANIRVQDARFQEAVVNYQNTLLTAGKEVEDGLITFLQAHKRTRYESESVTAEMAAFKQAVNQYQGGLTNYNRVVVIQEKLVDRQQALAEAQGQIALGLIQVYRALGGGWQIRCQGPVRMQPPIPGEDVPDPRPLPDATAPKRSTPPEADMKR
jgi:NodT family efflux transporter outer membrane factor (OMF) lipoprotein